MVRVAARYGVSSSFLARICSRLNVPRPSRGYWAQLEVGKAEATPALPAPRPGDELEWSREGRARRLPRARPQPPAGRVPSLYTRGDRPDRHELLLGVREQFEAGKVLDSGFLQPAKRGIVDVFVSKQTLVRALDIANVLFVALETRGHRVTLAPANQYLARPDVDVRSDSGRSGSSYGQWRPERATIVLVGTVAIGLTLFELTEEVEVRWSNGAYIRALETPSDRRRATAVSARTSVRDMPSGKLGLRASSPYVRTDWVHQWCEAGGSDLTAKVGNIVREIEASAPAIAALVDEVERQEEDDRKQREAAFETWNCEDADRRRLQNIKDSREELFVVIDAWGAVRRIEDFFADVERRVATIPEREADEVRERVRRARALIGDANAFGRLLAWKAPEEQ